LSLFQLWQDFACPGSDGIPIAPVAGLGLDHDENENFSSPRQSKQIEPTTEESDRYGAGWQGSF
jgi:hypothetical protein